MKLEFVWCCSCLLLMGIHGNALNLPPWYAGEAVPALHDTLVVTVFRLDSGDFEGAAALATGDVLEIEAGWGVHWGMTSKSLNSVTGTKANSAEHSGQA